MNNIKGMSVKQLNTILDEMRTIYPFKDEDAYLGNLRDIITEQPRQVEIYTKDEQTGISIILAKGVHE